MDEEMRDFMSEMWKKMDDLPTREQFDGFERTIKTNSTNIEANKTRIDDQDKRIRAVKESI